MAIITTTAQCSLVVAISGTTGSGARELGQRVAREFSCHYLDKQLILDAAERLKDFRNGWSQEAERFLQEIMVPPRPASRYVRCHLLAAPLMLAADDLAHLPVQMAIIRAATAWGPMVLVGRAGQWVLRDQESLLSIHLDAPLGARVSRIRKVCSLGSEILAERLVTYCDLRRANFIQRVAGYQADVPRPYDLSLDTAEVGLEGALDIIRHAVQKHLHRKDKGVQDLRYPADLAS